MKFPETTTIKAWMKPNAKICILTHQNPDGDAIGSSLALGNVLHKAGFRTTILTPNDFPEFLKWLPNAQNIIVANRKLKTAKSIIEKADLIFCLDFNASNRIAELEDSLKNSPAKKVLIDHHIEPELFCDITISNIHVSSTAELIYDFIVDLSYEKLIDKDTAEAIYVGLITDTGSFSFACNYPHLYEITAKLYQYGIDGENIHRLVYDTFSENRMRLLGYSLSEGMSVYPEFAIAYIALSRKVLDNFKHQIGDTEGIVNYPLSIKAIQMSALLLQKEDHIRISLRSKGEVNVNEIARRFFNGGGHKNAAGGKIFKPYEQGLAYFNELLPDIYKQYIRIYEK